MNIEEGNRVERTKGASNDIGQQGSVVETNEVSQRARIRWDNRKLRTWVSWSALKVIGNGQTNNQAGSGSATGEELEG